MFKSSYRMSQQLVSTERFKIVYITVFMKKKIGMDLGDYTVVAM